MGFFESFFFWLVLLVLLVGTFLLRTLYLSTSNDFFFKRKNLSQRRSVLKTLTLDPTGIFGRQIIWVHVKHANDIPKLSFAHMVLCPWRFLTTW